LTTILAAYPVGVIYIIVDNASIHSSKALLKWLAANTRVQLAYLPTYSGHHLIRLISIAKTQSPIIV
jgi:transposase